MSKLFTILSLLLILTFPAVGQEMTLNRVTLADLRMTSYDQDTAANAVVLDEWGKAYISNNENERLVFEHYLKIKILRKKGLDQANIDVKLYKGETSAETLLSAEGVTYNLENGVKKEMKLDPKAVYTSDLGKHTRMVRFALPAARVGSVLEVKYRTNSPFVFNFHPWEFQSEIPKVHSEFWASIPAVYIYNASFRGMLELTKNESTLEEDCYEPGGGNRASCVLTKYAIDHVPAFIEEDYMTASKNFIAAIRYELSEVHQFDGRVEKITKEWKNADHEMRQQDDFGVQLRKAENDLESIVKKLTQAMPTPLEKAQAIYQYIQSNYTWNGNYGMLTEVGMKKLKDLKKGNAADINLSLVGGLRAAGLVANPVILSTRENGTPVELFPVLSEFNYAIAALNIDGKLIFLDATSQLHPFGFLPLRCLNGKGRLMASESTWVDIKPKDRKKTTTALDVTLNADGTMTGKVTITSLGYAALSKRNEILEAGGNEADKKRLQASMKEIELVSYTHENLNDIEKPMIQRLEIRINAIDAERGQTAYFNPFIFDRIEENPFKQMERLYPVDFGSPIESILSMTIHFGPEFEIDEVPNTVALGLPKNGGRFLLSVNKLPSQVSVTSTLTIAKAIYGSQEYPFLKELFARIVQADQSPIVFRKK